MGIIRHDSTSWFFKSKQGKIYKKPIVFFNVILTLSFWLMLLCLDIVGKLWVKSWWVVWVMLALFGDEDKNRTEKIQ